MSSSPPSYSVATPEHLNTTIYSPGAASSQTLTGYDEETTQTKSSKLKKPKKGTGHLKADFGQVGLMNSHHPLYSVGGSPDNSNIVLNRSMQKNKVRN